MVSRSNLFVLYELFGEVFGKMGVVKREGEVASLSVSHNSGTLYKIFSS
jgi:hypothetical protein